MPEIYLKDILIHSDELQELPEDIVEKIIADGYEAASELVKYISNYIYDKHEILIGRIQKNQLKKYIEYRREEDYNIFIELIKQDIPKDLKLRELISNAINDSNKYYIDEAISEFIKNLQNSLNEGNNDRVLDYLTFLYSRLVNLNERRNSSVKSIFNENEKIIKKELSKEDYIFIKNICIDSNNEEPREKAVEHFNKQYIKLLEKNGNYEQKNSIIYVKIDQMLFDLFDSKELFYNYLFNLISLSYDKLQNHKTLAIRIENIMDGDLNIKWEIYAYLTIFAEKFKRIELNCLL